MEALRRRWADINFFESWRLMVAASELGEVREFDGLLVTNCGLPVPLFNVAFVQRPLAAPERSIDRAARYFRERELPARICVPEGLDARASEVVAERGYAAAETHPGMTLFPIPAAPTSAAGLEIRTVSTEQEFEDFQRTAAAGFGIPDALGRRLIGAALAEHPAVSMFVGYVARDPVCTSSLIRTGSVAGIYWVSTPPRFRKRGHGAAISWHAVRFGQSLGCDMASLQASAMGRPVYERMGFDFTASYRHYEIAPGVSGH